MAPPPSMFRLTEQICACKTQIELYTKKRISENINLCRTMNNNPLPDDSRRKSVHFWDMRVPHLQVPQVLVDLITIILVPLVLYRSRTDQKISVFSICSVCPKPPVCLQGLSVSRVCSVSKMFAVSSIYRVPSPDGFQLLNLKVACLYRLVQSYL